jgi:hypothetical protein
MTATILGGLSLILLMALIYFIFLFKQERGMRQLDHIKFLIIKATDEKLEHAKIALAASKKEFVFSKQTKVYYEHLKNMLNEKLTTANKAII